MFLIRTKSAALPVWSEADSSFMKELLMPKSDKAPPSAPDAAPTATPMIGLRKSTPTRSPQKLPVIAPVAVVFDELVELDVAVLGLDGDHGVTDGDQIFLLQFEQPSSDFFGLCFGRVYDRNQIRHGDLLGIPAGAAGRLMPTAWRGD